MQINTLKIYARLKELMFTNAKIDREELNIMLAQLELASMNKQSNYTAKDIREHVNIDLATRIIYFFLERY